MGTDAQVRPSAGEIALAKAFGGAFTANQVRALRLLVCIQNVGDPTNAITPDYLGQFCLDTAAPKLYVATTAASSGWQAQT